MIIVKYNEFIIFLSYNKLMKNFNKPKLNSKKKPYSIMPKNLMLSINLSTLFIGLLWSIFPILFLIDYPLTDEAIITLFIFIIAAHFTSIHLNSKVISKYFNLIFDETHNHQTHYHEVENLLKAKEKKLSSFLKQAPIGIFYYDCDLKIVRYNTMFKNLLGVKKELKAFDLHTIKDKETIDTLKQVLLKPSKKETIGSFDFSFNQNKIWVELTCSSLLNEENEIIGGIGTIEDKSAEHLAYEKINYISLHDALTSLPNRRSYQAYMQNLISKVEHREHYSFLFYMDLNHFKHINDTFGHTVGDKLLLSVADRFRTLKVKEKYLSRLGGDEFIMIVPFYSQELLVAQEKAKEIALKLKSLFNEPFQIEGLDLSMTTSIGIVLIEPNANNTEKIIRQADMAMYQTKREGLNNIRFYDHSLDREQQELTSLQHDLKDAIDNNELQLYYQPIVSITDNSLNAIEALVRWNHPTRGIIMPDRFIPMATESGLISRVGWWVAKEVCHQLYLWKKTNSINFDYISLNINSRQINEINFVEQLDNHLKEKEINPSLLKLELTESTLIDNFKKTQSIIKRLKENGIDCSIDGFGTGYSSLSYLKKFAFKVLKIDKIFIQDILTNIDNQELVKSIIDIGQRFNYKIIVEGIETEEQREKIRDISETIYYQGYLCSKPLPAKAFERRFL